MDNEALSSLFQYLVYEKYLRSHENKTETKTEEKQALVDVVDPDLRRKLRVLYDILEMPKGEDTNIFSESGTKIVHNGHIASITKALEDDAKQYLEKGTSYTVKTCLPFDNYTMIEIQEYPGILFDAAAFSPADTTPKDEDALLRQYGPDLDADLEQAQIWKEAVQQMAD